MFLRIIAISASLFMVGAPIANAQDVTSVCTNLDIERDCEWPEAEYQGGSALCTGYAGYPVLLVEGDARIAAHLAEQLRCGIEPFT